MVVCSYHFDEFKKLYDGGVEQVVSGTIVQQSINDRLKKVPFSDVAVVILILEANDPAHKTKCTSGREVRYNDYMLVMFTRYQSRAGVFVLTYKVQGRCVLSS